jgi:hypothetical protein
VNKEALVNFTGLLKDGGLAELLSEISAPLSLIKIYQMRPISARSISMGDCIEEREKKQR